MSPFFGPFSLGSGDNVPDIGTRLRQAVPGLTGTTSYPGAGGSGTAALGFTAPGPILFLGQPVSSRDIFQTAPPMATSAMAGQPESITQLLSGLSLPSLPAISTAPIRPAVGGGYSDATGGGGESPSDGPGGMVGGISGTTPGVSSDSSGNTPNGSIGTGISGLGMTGTANAAGIAAASNAAGLANSVASGITSSAVSGVTGIPGLGLAISAAIRAASDVDTTMTDAMDAVSDAAMNAMSDAMGLSESGIAPGIPGDPSADGNANAGIAGVPGDPSADGDANAGMDGSGSGGGAGGAGGGTVICTELHRQGLLADDLFQLDQRFGEWIIREHPEVYAGYIAWAPRVVARMRRSPRFTRFVTFWVRAWATEMAAYMEPHRRGSLLGALMMSFGVPVCRWLGKRRIVQPIL